MDDVYRITGIGAPPGVAVWSLDLDASSPVTAECLLLLSADERIRYAALRRDLDRVRFARRRAWRRLLLAAELRASPTDLRFVTGLDGKPRLACGSLCFSTSTAGNRFVLAAARRREVGIDVAPQSAPDGWTRIEALAKALGCGLTIAPETLAAMDLSAWIECGFEPAPGFVATLLVAR